MSDVESASPPQADAGSGAEANSEAALPSTPLGPVRMVVRGTVLVISMVIGYAVWQLGRLFCIGSPDRARRWRSRVFGGWARRAWRILGMRVKVRGELPASPCVLVSNHLSYTDIILLAGVVEGVFVSKAEVERWPVLGPITRHMGTIYIDRLSKRHIPEANARIAEALGRGDSVVLFPEGTSTQGAEVRPFKPSLLEPAVQSAYPVCYSSVTYRTPPDDPPASLAVCWWGDMTFFGHLPGLLQLSQFEATVTFGDEILRESDRKVLAQKLWKRVSALFEPVR